jgi:hypothetical protein
MKRIYIIILILGVTISCDRKNNEVVSNRHFFYSNGILKSEGKNYSENEPIGIWNYYDSTGTLERIVDYRLINGKTYLNQDWYVSKLGDTIANRGSNFNIIFDKDTISIREPIKAYVNLETPLFKNDNSSIFIVIPKDYSININEDFSNLEMVNLDTIYNLSLENEMRKASALTGDLTKTAFFGRYFDSVGNQKFRGIIVEYFYKDSIMGDSTKLNYFENKKYFEKDVFVIDTSTIN